MMFQRAVAPADSQDSHMSRDGAAVDTVPGSRPLTDGYCGVWRPSLTDSKLKGQSPGLAQTYQLDQGLLCYASSAKSGTLPRLGLAFQVRELHSVDPTTGTWQGEVRLHLCVAGKETLGLDLREGLQGEDLDRQWERVQQAWPVVEESWSQWGQASSEDPMQFLAQAFGVRVYNVVKGAAPSVRGPSRMSELDLSEGVIGGRWSIEGTFFVPVELSGFPFDTLSWDVIISIIGWSPGIIDMMSSSLINVEEFDIYGLRGQSHPSKNFWVPYVCESNVVPNDARLGESLAYCRFHSRRRPALSVMTNIVLPMCLMAFLGVVGVMQATGSIQNSNSETDGVALEATLLLTVTAMRFNYADTVPKSQLRPTLLDKYIISVMMLLAVTTVGIVLVHEDDMELLQAPWLYIVVVLTLHAYFCFCAWRELRIPPERKAQVLNKTPHAPPEGGCSGQVFTYGFVTKAEVSALQ
ncbi:unnamed protein product [Prorocentrum cordatum]|uniref:Neurotransmitter-gated ion-channel ligand-binding domain-containing protein n=1 Tax=Prorocentrum cordatum TaxID=2364126 RepID=A0ABN9R6W4_9DINO|nr:unnamed protein product [Polarella glacialis]